MNARWARLAVSVGVVCLVSGQAGAASRDISTFAGGGQVSQLTVLDSLNSPQGSTSDSLGNLYVADTKNSRIVKFFPQGRAPQVVAGNPTLAGTWLGDGGEAVSAGLSLPGGVAVDSDGNLYIADTGNNRIRKVDTSGTITTVAGNGLPLFMGDGGQATTASLNAPSGVGVDTSGNLFIADTKNNRIRMVDPSGVISTLAGNGVAGFSGDGASATAARVNQPFGLSFDAGAVFVADTFNHRIRKVDLATRKISTIAGNGVNGFLGDGGPAASAAFSYPYGVSASGSNTFVADTSNYRIRKISGGNISTVAGNGIRAFTGDGGLATSASLNTVYGVSVDAIGNLWISDTLNSRIRKVSSGVIDSVAGTGRIFCCADDQRPATAVELWSPGGVAQLGSDVLVADTLNHRIMRVNAAGIASTFAGGTQSGAGGDGGQATAANLNKPQALAVDASGNVYIADNGNNKIRKVSPSGIISTFAGTGVAGGSGDGGAATSATLREPSGVTVDPSGNLYIADTGNHRIRKVSSVGVISTVAGNGLRGSSGDGGDATQASLNRPAGVAVDASGDILIADTDNDSVRRVIPAGVIYNVVGSSSDDPVCDPVGVVCAYVGVPAPTVLDAPFALTVFGQDILVSDSAHNRLLKISPDGSIETLAGTGIPAFLGDGGPGNQASMNNPKGVIVLSDGSILVADSGNNRIRRLR